MDNLQAIRSVAPRHLGTARAIAHQAVQVVTKAARANITPAADDRATCLKSEPEPSRLKAGCSSHWHTEGFLGAVAMAEAILALDDVPTGLNGFIDGAYRIGRKGLGL